MHRSLEEHCCKLMQKWIQDENSPIYYTPKHRDYGVSAPDALLKKNEVWKGYGLTFCPGCGTKLPPDLIEKWMEILKNDYNIDCPFYGNQKRLIPLEFLTDEWWKKRGL